MLYRLLVFTLAFSFAFAPNTFGGQTLKDDTEKERAKRAAENSPNGAKEEPATKLEKFLARKNVLIIKDTFAIGSVPGQQGAEVKIEVLVLSAAGEASKIYGLSLRRFANRTNAGERQNLNEAISFIDFDEMASLQNALEQMVKAANDLSGETNAAARPNAANEAENEALNSSTEFSLTTRGGLKTGMLQVGRQQTGFVHFSVASQDAAVFFGIGALGRLRNLIAQARAKLTALGAR